MIQSKIDFSYNIVFMNHTNGLDVLRKSHSKIHQNKFVYNESTGVYV